MQTYLGIFANKPRFFLCGGGSYSVKGYTDKSLNSNFVKIVVVTPSYYMSVYNVRRYTYSVYIALRINFSLNQEVQREV